MTFLRPKSFLRSRGAPLSKPFRPRVPRLRLMRFPPGNVFLLSRVPRLHSRFFPLKTIVLSPRPKPFPPGTRFLQPYIIPDFPLDILHSKPSPLRMRFILARARDSCLRTASGLRLRTPAISPDFSPS